MPSINEMTAAGRTTRRGVRLWEERGLLGEVERSPGGTRRYTMEQIRRAKIIAGCQAVGMTLTQIDLRLRNWTPLMRQEIIRELGTLAGALPPAEQEFDL